MSEQPTAPQTDPSAPAPKKGTVDSFGNPVEKSPWGMFALLQIPIVILMIVILYFLYQARDNS